ASPAGPEPPDARVEAVVTASTAELDLAEADRVLGVGAGLGDERFVALAAAVATAMDLCLGATRVVTDHGWLPVERQIGTTGVEIRPRIYVALGISGAVQHVAGLGDPDHVVSVNLDGSCPMAAMAELNLVADARAVLIALADRLGVPVDPDLRATLGGGAVPASASPAPASPAPTEEHP
ncbi:MAG: electron transfer flavoprotein subunit alpha/FixB family protein, partial [Actinomyces sp.]